MKLVTDLPSLKRVIPVFSAAQFIPKGCQEVRDMCGRHEAIYYIKVQCNVCILCIHVHCVCICVCMCVYVRVCVCM